jgi:hypothetical protein
LLLLTLTSLLVGVKDLRNRAAQAIYDKCSGIIPLESAAPALRRALSRGTSVAGAYLLLGRTSGAETISTLAPFIDRTSGVKLQPWLAPVPVPLAASVALLRAGQPDARDRVLSAVSNGPLAESVFVLYVLDDIRDHAALKAVAALLNDQREISGGVPSHASPMRRVADLAVDALTARLGIRLTFPLTSSRRYSDLQFNEARTAVAAALAVP